MTCIELDERDGQMEHVCVSAPPHGVECRVKSRLSRLQARCGSGLALVFFSQTSPAGCGRRPGTRPGPRTGKGPEVEVDTGFVDGPQASI
jgi:hypothetical protein